MKNVVDRSDPLELLTVRRDWFFTGIQDQTHEIKPPELVSFNNYPGAVTVVNRRGKNHAGVPVDVIYYFAIIIHEDNIIWAQIQARTGNGGESIPIYAEQVLNSLELR